METYNKASTSHDQSKRPNEMEINNKASTSHDQSKRPNEMEINNKASTSHDQSKRPNEMETNNKASTSHDQSKRPNEMEINNKASTSHDQSDSSDDNDEHHKKLSTEQLCLKIKTCRNLCFGNKINVSNAFDIDMIQCFYSWLEKKKSSIFDNDNDVTSFQEISDYLEATAKVYSYRVDNLSETTSKLVEQFKSINDDNNDNDDDNAPKIQKSKRQKIMLTTNEKLRRKPNEFENIINPGLIDHSISNFNCNELFFTDRPSRLFTSLYHGKSFAEEMKTYDDEKKEYDEKKENYETTEIDESLCLMMEECLKGGSLCPEFAGFIAERDKVDNSNDDELNGIEYHFNPDDHQFLEDNNSKDSITSNESENKKLDNNELDSNSNDKDTTVLDGLLDCIDNVHRDYSFFNPKLLANWNGPHAWKSQAMLKALKSSTPSERKDIISNIDQNIDESTQKNTTHSKTHKKNNKVKKNGFKVNWLAKNQLNKILKNHIKSKEKMLPRSLLKWDPLDNITDSKTVIADVKYEFQFVKYIKVIPDWWTYKKNQVNDTWSEDSDSDSSQNTNDCGNSIAEIPESIQSDNKDYEHLDNRSDEEVDDKLNKLDVSGELNPEDEDALADIRTESKMDIAILKTEISDIIDKECVETDPNSEWSSKLSFLNLLINLRINDRDELSIPIVFVGLLHLANERGLKLFQEHCTINDMEETFIAKPIKKK